MPNFDRTGPKGSGRSGRFCGNANRYRHGQIRTDSVTTDELSSDYIYEYTLEELIERIQALEKEIQWIEQRIREFNEN